MKDSSLYTCIYCLSSKQEFSAEHVVPQAFGRFKDNLVLRDCVCKDCNSYFGETIDRALARGSLQGVIRYFRGLKPLKEFKKPDRKRIRLSAQVPGRKNFEEAEIITTEQGEGIALKPGFTYQSVSTGTECFVSLETLERGNWDGAKDIDRQKLAGVTYRNKDTLNRLKKALKKLDLQLDILGTLTEQTKPGQPILVAIDALIEDEVIRRCIAKIALNYLAYVKGSEFARRGSFNKIRAYIRYGDYISTRSVRRIGRLRLYGDTEEAKRRRGHVVTLDLDQSGVNIISSLEFFGLLTYRVELGTFEDLIIPISAGHYYDIVSMHVLAMGAIRRPPELWIPT